MKPSTDSCGGGIVHRMRCWVFTRVTLNLQALSNFFLCVYSTQCVCLVVLYNIQLVLVRIPKPLNFKNFRKGHTEDNEKNVCVLVLVWCSPYHGRGMLTVSVRCLPCRARAGVVYFWWEQLLNPLSRIERCACMCCGNICTTADA